MRTVAPLKMNRVLVEKPWGGTRLSEVPGIPLPPGKKIGESWELADHDHGMTSSAVPERSLREWMEVAGEAILGRARPTHHGRFPLLVKFIHAAEPLSVQVHPDDVYARERAADVGKTEAWYILDAEPEAWVIAGFRDGVRGEDYRRLAATPQVEDLLQRHRVCAGDMLFIPAGTVHAIGPGVVLAEVQQNSDLTYRLFDWDRTGRQLHVEDGIACSAIEPHGGPQNAPALGPREGVELLRCDRFAMHLWSGAKPPAELEGAPVILQLLAGHAALRAPGAGPIRLAAGDTVLIPACVESYEIEAGDEARSLLATPTELD